jgi:hypothetical protein
MREGRPENNGKIGDGNAEKQSTGIELGGADGWASHPYQEPPANHGARADFARTRGSASQPSECGPGGGFDPPYTFLRNEPTVLAGEILWIMRIVKYLCRLQRVFAGGFVLENEPTGGVF